MSLRKRLQPVFIRSLGPVLKGYMALLKATCRVRVHGKPPTGAAVYAIWHGRLACMPLLAPTDMRTSILSSPSRDGRLGGAVGKAFGFGVAFGSSSKRGAEGARALVKILQDGGNIFLTPDGPKGPACIAKPGATSVAELAGVPVVPCAGEASRAITFGSWDKLQLPLPFSTISVHYGKPLPAATPESLTKALNTLQLQAAQALKKPSGQDNTAHLG